MAQSFPRSSSRPFVIGLLIAAALLVLFGEKASAQDVASFYEPFLEPSYTVPGYDPSAAGVPQSAPLMPMKVGGNNNAASPFGPLPGFSPFGPLPRPLCGDPWTTPGLGLFGDDIPLRVCVL